MRKGGGSNGRVAGDSGCPKNELPPYVLRQLGVGLAVPSRPVPYGIVTLRYAYSEQLRAARDDSCARCRPSVFLDHC